MKATLQLKLDAICKYPFFEKAGQSLPSGVKPAKDWNQAARSSGTKKWGNCQLMARNALQVSVQNRSWQRMQEWNPLAGELRPLILAFVDTLLPRLSLTNELLKNVKNSVSWDIICICFEEEYRDMRCPFFYILYVDKWYASGHFPCGWNGDEFPEGWDGVIRGGQLIVF